LADGAGLSDHVGEFVLGLLFGMQVGPFETEILLEEFPAYEVVGDIILLVHDLQLEVAVLLVQSCNAHQMWI
jgi:hypothetical protein